MKLKTTISTTIAAITLVSLSACTPVASNEPALEKGQPAPQEEPVAQEEPAVPQECFDALDSAEEVDDILTQGVILSADAINYAIDLDVAGLDQVNADLEELVPQAEEARTSYASAAATCESAAPPESCADALDSAEDIDDNLTQALESSSRSIEYAIDLNVTGLEEETALIEDLTPQLEEARINFAMQAAACRTNEGV